MFTSAGRGPRPRRRWAAIVSVTLYALAAAFTAAGLIAALVAEAIG